MVLQKYMHNATTTLGNLWKTIVKKHRKKIRKRSENFSLRRRLCELFSCFRQREF